MNEIEINNNSSRYFSTITAQFKKIVPKDLSKFYWSVLPLIIAQILQRLYFVVDNHYIAVLGENALLIHNIQFSFLYIGQYIGAATGTSCLIFWRRNEYIHNQNAVFNYHMLLCFVVTLLCVIGAGLFSYPIMHYFNVPKSYLNIATFYFEYGLFNMALQSVYVSMFGVSVASGKEKLTLLTSAMMLFIAIFVDRIAVYYVFDGDFSVSSITKPLFIMIVANSILLMLGILILFILNRQKKSKAKLIGKKAIFKVWINELGGGLLTGFDPIIYVFQLGLVATKESLLVTYQLLMQLAGIFCIPLYAVMQIAVRDASEKFDSLQKGTFAEWLKTLILFGLIPTILLMFVYLGFPQKLFTLTYNYIIPSDQMSYAILFLAGSIIGQIGNALTVPTRAKKNSHHVTLVYFLSDFLVLIAGMQLVIFFDIATPFTAGLVMFSYTVFYTIMNAYFARKSLRI